MQHEHCSFVVCELNHFMYYGSTKVVFKEKKHYILYKYHGTNIYIFLYIYHSSTTIFFGSTLAYILLNTIPKHGIAPQYIFYHGKKHGISMVPV